MWLFIRPLDTVCCRDGRPFTAGEGVMAKTMFPPLPSTFYGAIRSAILAEHAKTFNQFHEVNAPYDDLPEVGTPGKFGTLQISGPCLAKKDENFNDFEFYFPAPAHFVHEKNAEERYHKLLPNAADPQANQVSDLKIPVQFMQGPHEIVKRFEGFLNINGVQKILYQEKKIPEKKDVCDSHALFKTLWQVGLERKFGSRTAEEGQLYNVGHYQMPSSHPHGFYLKVEGLTQEFKSGILKLGGEWRAAAYESSNQPPFNDTSLDAITDVVFKNKRFFLWLITPAVFKHGYFPGFLDPSTLKGSLKGISVKLIACQTLSKKYIGGFRLGKGGSGGSKIGYWATPAGSVYFFELSDQTEKSVVSAFVRKQMFDKLEGQLDDMAIQGFGTTLIGGY